MVPMNVDGSTVAATSIITAVITFFFATSVGKVKPAASLALAVAVGIILNAIGVIPIGLLLVVGFSMIVAIYKTITSPTPSESERRHALGYAEASPQALNLEDAKTLFDRGQALRVKCILETGSSQDLAEAFSLIKKSAEQGFSKAQHMLGYMYNNGEGTDRNGKDACRWCLLSAQQGDLNGQAYLGSMLADENCIFHNYSEAAKWLLKAAEQGSESAQTKLGGLYYKGLGVQKNYSEAAKWYRLAEAQGCMEANSMLGVMRAHGEV